MTPLLNACQNSSKSYESIVEDENLGVLDNENLTYSQEFKSAYTEFEDCIVNITVQLIGHEDNSNYSNFYIDSVEFVSIDVVSGWDSVEFEEIDGLTFGRNNQEVSVLVYYRATKDGKISEETAGPVVEIPENVRYNETKFEKV